MNDGFSIPPEVGELLQEIDHDPERALRTFAVHAVRGWRSRSGRGARATALAEDALAEVHRDRVAVLLGRAAQRQILEDPFWEGLLYRNVRVGAVLVPLPAAEGRARAASLVRRSHGAGLEGELAALESIRRGDPADTLDLALASWRLARNNQAALSAAFEYIKRKQWPSADRLLHEIVTFPVTNLEASIAWGARGTLSLQRYEPADALEAFRMASKTDTARPGPLGSLFVVATSLGKVDHARDAAARLEELVSSSDPSVLECIRAFRELRCRNVFDARLGGGVPRGNIVRGPATNMIANELL